MNSPFEMLKKLRREPSAGAIIRISYAEHPKPEKLANELLDFLKEHNITLDDMSFIYDYDKMDYVISLRDRSTAIMLKLTYG
jgi:hypothetical protein